MTTELITAPIPTEIDTTRVSSLGQEISVRCKALAVIDSQDKADEAGRIIKDAAKVKGIVEAELDPVRVATHRAWKSACDIINRHLSFTDDVKALSGRVAGYITAEREKAERARREAEAKARAEAEAAAKAERDRLIEQAAEMEKQGMTKAAERTMKEAEKVEAAPIQVQAPIVPDAPKVSGLTTRDNWKARLIDIGQVPREYLCFDQKAADAFARATKGTKNVPGIEFYNDPSTVNLGR